MSTFIVRRATSLDQAAIRHLIREGQINPFRNHWCNFVVAETLNGEVIGCGQIRTHGHHSRELASLVVVRGWRRQGIATKIVEGLLKDNQPPLWLVCRSGLVDFYQGFGFREVEGAVSIPWIYKLVRLWARMRFRVTAKGGYLAVMVWSGAES
jgi:N-acetylglutamate synthase-like GNAT family acetyltransferase